MYTLLHLQDELINMKYDHIRFNEESDKIQSYPFLIRFSVGISAYELCELDRQPRTRRKVLNS